MKGTEGAKDIEERINIAYRLVETQYVSTIVLYTNQDDTKTSLATENRNNYKKYTN